METRLIRGLERIFSDNLCSAILSIDWHIRKHNLDCCREDYVEIGEEVSKGRQGVSFGKYKDRWYTAVVKGTILFDGKEFGVLRSVYIPKVRGIIFPVTIPYTDEIISGVFVKSGAKIIIET